jgi:hypothetical protein
MTMTASTVPADVTTQQWDALQQELYFFLGKVVLEHDGNRITLQRVQFSECELGIMVYINGSLAPSWGIKSSEQYRPDYCRYFLQKTKSRYSKKDILKLEKLVGKRRAKKEHAYLYEKFVHHEPVFLLFSKLRAQFRKLDGLKVLAIGREQCQALEHQERMNG